MRARNLKPSFFKNEALASIAPLARILFQGLWCMADRRGRMEDRPLRIKVEVLPYDNCDIDSMLNELCKLGFIWRYNANRNRYIQIINFEKHQFPHHREPDSPIPAPGNTRASPRPAQGFPSTSLGLAHLNPESPILNPESPIPIPQAKPDFEKVWAAYPRRKGRKAAERHFKATVKTQDDEKRILKALENYKRSKEVREGFIQYGSTWFNDWQSWEENNDAHNEHTGVPSVADSFRKNRESRRHSELRKISETSVGKVLDGVGDMPMDQTIYTDSKSS